MLSMLTGCGGTDEPEPASNLGGGAPEVTVTADGTRENPFVGHGIIQEVGDGHLVIAHDTIPGFMGAMTMPYPAATGAMDDALEPGQEVTFDVELLDLGFQVFRIERVE
jgi:hypothetical protein